ncbi:hypothetical protein ACFQV2_02770 [Actinokineospora soli]|uniref:Uncharacterized protein n=1 Tax=Actinokineospora soli TaxID=1048753 RepID=A0ABW2TG70_9PSEU
MTEPTTTAAMPSRADQRSTPRDPEPVDVVTGRHPHGLLGHIVDDEDRTRRAVRLVRCALPAVLLTLVVLITGAVVLVAVSPPRGRGERHRHRRGAAVAVRVRSRGAARPRTTRK